MEVPPFDVSVEWEDGQPIVTICGELDFATAPILQEALKDVLDKGAEHLILDFHQVTFLDSEGLKVLLLAYRLLRDRGGRIAVEGCSRFVAKTFEILGLHTYFDICPERNQNRS